MCIFVHLIQHHNIRLQFSKRIVSLIDSLKGYSNKRITFFYEISLIDPMEIFNFTKNQELCYQN